MNRVYVFEPFAILGLATLVLVVVPFVQFGRLAPDPARKALDEQAVKGRAQYASLGCVYCHSQQPRDPSFAPDAQRGWGRASTPRDYAGDAPHFLGTMRTGPDLFNVGQRLPGEDWHLTHLYQPRAVVPGSIMPSYPFLFEVKKEAAPGDRVVSVPKEFAPQNGVVVAKPEALQLVAYLRSLDHSYASPDLPKTAEGRDVR